MFELVLIAVMAALPVLEVRGAIPLAYYYFGNDPWMKWVAVSTAVAVNLAVAPAVLAGLRWGETWLLRKDSGFLGKVRALYLWLVSRARDKGRRYLSKWGYVGLAAFVAIPAPGSGAWTGCLIAHVFGLERKASIISVEVGVLIASVLVTAAMEGALQILGFLVS